MANLGWLFSSSLRHLGRRPLRSGDPVHLLLCIADHFEPKRGNATPEVARSRMARWVSDYPRLFGDLRDSDGRPPQHSHFYPQDEYEAEHLDALADFCRAGYGEVEIHLHHADDTADGLRDKLEGFKNVLAGRHGMLSRHRGTGDLAYAFIHGNWALDNSLPGGVHCGVNNELDILQQTGCYADMTLPSYPSPAQTRKVNSIYYAVDDPARPKSHDTGVDVGRVPRPTNSLMLIQGPLTLDWGRRKWGVIPRVENGCLQGNQAPSMDRLALWLGARVQVPTRPDWFFVKLHTHGLKEANQSVVLGQHMVRFHEDLARRAADDPTFHYHYVTAREMYNLARAAEAGWGGGVNEARDYELVWNGPARGAVRQKVAASPRSSNPVV